MKKIFSLSYKLGKKILLLKNSNTLKMSPVIIFISFIILLRCVTNQLANQIISILFYIVIVLLEIIFGVWDISIYSITWSNNFIVIISEW